MSSKEAQDREILEFGKEIITSEINTLKFVSENLSDSFCHAVTEIVSMGTSGHVIVSGMGKAGFIAMKLSATLASTGIPSFFLHPAEALHGDLGRYRKNDLALILTNSGETEEVIKIIPQIRSIGCPIISITASKESTIGKYSDIVIELGAIEEACPIGLAPTASTTAMLAIGDALAMTILKQQKFTPEQFAAFHPGGNLGRKLLKITDIMRNGDSHCIVSEEMTCREVIQAITSTVGRPGAAAVVLTDGSLAGIFTDGNLRRLLSEGIEFLDKPIKDFMTPGARTLTTDCLAADAMQVLSTYKIDQVIIVDADNKPVGLVDVQDLFAVKPASEL